MQKYKVRGFKIIVPMAIAAGVITSTATYSITNEPEVILAEAQKESETENYGLTAGVSAALYKITVPMATKEPEPEPVTTKERREVLVKSIDLDENESYLLAKIAMAEAEGEDTEGKALVMLTVLNRVQNKHFPDSIESVIMQYRNGTYQFECVQSGGRFWTTEPNEDCWAALELIQIHNWDESEGALYFERKTATSTWHSRNLKELFTHGKHTFYTTKEEASE